jgi:cupin 2 domain-containing protein
MQTNAFTVERIVSSGHFTAVNKPYVQDFDEWVVLLTGEAEVTTENNVYQLVAGDYLFLPAGKKHWVSKTSSHPECVWLAVTSKNNKS